jgi:hypothetical protein
VTRFPLSATSTNWLVPLAARIPLSYGCSPRSSRLKGDATSWDSQSVYAHRSTLLNLSYPRHREAQRRKDAGSRSVVNRLRSKLLKKTLDVVLHCLDHLGRVSLPISVIARDPQRIPGAV